VIDILRKARSLLLDSNLLLLYLVGSFSRGLVISHKRTRDYTLDDFDLIRAIISDQKTLVTTPSVVTEVSNLIRHIDEPTGVKLMGFLGSVCQKIEERYTESAVLARSDSFDRLGLTDSALLDLSEKGLLLLTSDLHLYLTAQRIGCRVINFNHIRSLG
jgi:hypothetical protein